MHMIQCNYLIAVVIMGTARVKKQGKTPGEKTLRVRERKGTLLDSLLPTLFIIITNGL